MRAKASNEGIHEIYRQTSLFAADHIQVRDFRQALENKYGRDTRSRKGNEIIFTTEQLLHSRQSCDALRVPSAPELCPMRNHSVFN